MAIAMLSRVNIKNCQESTRNHSIEYPIWPQKHKKDDLCPYKFHSIMISLYIYHANVPNRQQ